jgi:hypothetical protein
MKPPGGSSKLFSITRAPHGQDVPHGTAVPLGEFQEDLHVGKGVSMRACGIGLDIIGLHACCIPKLIASPDIIVEVEP